MKFVAYTSPEKKLKLDMKDKRILSLLAKDARTSIANIARKVKLSRDAVGYRLKRYEEIGLVEGYRTIIDIHKFGFDNYHVFLQMLNPSENDEKKIIQELKEFPFIRGIIKFTGKYDIELAMVARSIDEFQDHLDEVLSTCDKYLGEYEILIITKYHAVKTFPTNFLGFSEDSEIRKKVKKHKLNKKDLEILEIIANDARIKLYKVANRLKISPDAVNYRLKNMINSGHIARFVPAIKYTLIGYNLYAVMVSMKSFTTEIENKLRQFFKNDKNILWAVKTIGKYNSLFYISTPDERKVHETINSLRNMFPGIIKDIEVLIGYDQYKYTYLPEAILNL